MEKKCTSKPMKEILSRIKCETIEIIIFEQDMIMRKLVTQWPVVDVLICFYSDEFPLKKALKYVRLVKPFLINDL